MTPDYFNKKCFACHSFSHETCTSSNSDKRNNCISCHMPSSSTIDIPHVTITDHKIGIFGSVLLLVIYKKSRTCLNMPNMALKLCFIY